MVRTERERVWRIGIYIRLSKEDGNDESLSVANQRSILQEFIRCSFEGEYILVDEYVDDGATGTDYERPSFQRMLRDIEGGRVNCVICKNLARAFRNYSDQGYFLEHFFPLHATRFITLGGPKIDSFLNPEAVHGYEIPISGIMNDRYAGRTSLDVRRTFDMKRRKGAFIGAFAPYGYRKDPLDKNHLLPDEEAANVVRDVFGWYLDGMSKRAVAKRLNELGIPNPTRYKRERGLCYANPNQNRNDGLWSPRTVAAILENQVYTGTMVQGRQRVISYKVHDCVSVPKEEWFVVEDTHEPIVDKETFRLVQNLCRRDTRTTPGEGKVSLLAGLVFCADCGKAMRRSSARGVGYYCCRTYQEKSRTVCGKHAVRVETVENTVLVVVQKQIGLLGPLDGIADGVSRAPARQTEAARRTALLRQKGEELERTRGLLDELYLDWKGGNISKDEYSRMRVRLTGKIERLQDIVARLAQERAEQQGGIREEDAGLASFLEKGNVERLERGLAVTLIDRILIHENKEIEIRFRYFDPFFRIWEGSKAGSM